MERGDISTTLPPRMLITFGRVIATPHSAVELATGVRGHGPPLRPSGTSPGATTTSST